MGLVDFCGQHEIVLRQAIDLVGPGRDLDFSPGTKKVLPGCVRTAEQAIAHPRPYN